MTTSQLAINLLAELIPGYMMPNNAVANMVIIKRNMEYWFLR